MENGKQNLGFRLRRKTRYVACEVHNGFKENIVRLREFGIMPALMLFVLGLGALFVAFAHSAEVGAMTLAQVGALKIKLKMDGLDGDDKKEEKAFMEKLQKRFEDIEIPEAFTKAQAEELYTKAIKEALEPYAKMKEFSVDKIKALLDDKEGVMAILVKQGAEITKLKNEGVPEKAKSVRDQVAEWYEKNKENIALINSGQKKDLTELKVKAPITMLESASLGGSAYLPNVQMLPGVINLIRKSPTFWDRLLKPSTKANPLVWVNKYNKQGNAEFTSEGALKSQASFELQTESSVPRKTTEFMKVSTEMLNDIDYLTGLIEGELRYEVDMSSNLDVLTGSGVAPHPKGVTLYGAAFALPTLTGVIAPNNTDAIVASIAMLRSLNFTGKLTAFVNPIDKAQMDLAKGLNGQYVNRDQVPVDAEIVEDNNIAVGYLLIGDMSKYHIQMYQDFYVQWGFVNDDFTKNLVTVIGERRFHQWVSSNETAAFVYDQFATIRAAIA